MPCNTGDGFKEEQGFLGAKDDLAGEVQDSINAHSPRRMLLPQIDPIPRYRIDIPLKPATYRHSLIMAISSETPIPIAEKDLDKRRGRGYIVFH